MWTGYARDTRPGAGYGTDSYPAAARDNLTSRLDGATLYGLDGPDFLVGGANNDTFIFSPDDGADTVTDFAASGTDAQLWFASTNLHSLADVLAAAGFVGGNTVITYNGTNTITLNGVSPGQLTAGDFIFS